MSPRWQLHGERGASLIMVMAFMIVFFTILTALIGLVFTANRTTNTYRQDRALRYAADSALEVAVVKAQLDQSLGDGPDPELCAELFIDGSEGGLPNPRAIFADGSRVQVDCSPTPGMLGPGTSYRDITLTVTCGISGGGPGDQVQCDPRANQVELGEARVRYDVDPGHSDPAEAARVPKIISWVLHR